MTPSPAHGPHGPTVPDRGDIVRIDFDPQAGREQKGHRPALVLSRAAYNGKTGLALLCPITSRIKGYPFEVRLPDGLPVTGVVLTDQLRCVDWRTRNAQVCGHVSPEVLTAVLEKLTALLFD